MDDLKDFAFIWGALTCAAALVYKLRDLRTNPHDRALLALIAAFGCKTVSLVLTAPTTSAALERWIDMPNICALGVHLFGGVASSTAILIALGYWSYPPERARSLARIWLGAAGAMAVTLIGLWLVAKQTVSDRPGNYLLDNMQQPIVAVYLLLYIAAFAAGLMETLRLCLRYATKAADPWLRQGLRLTAIGAAIYLVYCVHRVLGVTAVLLGTKSPTPEIITPLCIGVGVELLAIGLTIPSWGPRLFDLSSWLRSYRYHQALYPLWRDLYQVTPTIALDPPQSRLRDRLRVRDIHFHLYRRVIEINDGRLALRRYMDPAVLAEATRAAHGVGLSGEHLTAAVEAARLDAALRTKESGVAVQDDSPQVPGEQSDDFADEVRWLVAVSQHRLRRVGPADHQRVPAGPATV
ncbi:MAB_1171c family putative transporter [Krasilnikovia sp. MM14-A1004]|uniref:MAB_1171c family putative transporter n=1 Tax=Krasilnikovia sp. MM14-A1004 TaxID=3373541 RepID=UPI00399D0FB2